jgi:hypothetical protein
MLDQKDGVDAAIVLRVVGHLGVLAPDHLATCCDQTKLTDIDLDDGTLGDDTLVMVELVYA